MNDSEPSNDSELSLGRTKLEPPDATRSKILVKMRYPMLLRLLALVCVFDVLKVSRGETLKLDVHYRYVVKHGFGLFHTLVDENGQDVDVLVDTRSGLFFFAEKKWFEKATGLFCLAAPLGCYECSKPCSVGKVSARASFDSDYSVSIFPHKSKLTIGKVSESFTFGLIFDQKPPVTEVPPINVMGLGFDNGDEDFPSVMTQLRSSKAITTDIIALYLYPPTDPTGESIDGGLLLGGSDPALYEGALKYVDLSTDEGYMVNIDKLQVGDGTIISGINTNVDLDSGANYLCVPKLYYNRLIKDIGAQTDKVAGKHVVFKFDQEIKTWTFPCQYMSKLPPLTFALGPQGSTSFTMTSTNYAVSLEGTCYLLIMENQRDDWSFHDRMLIDRYFEFDPTRKRVGLGKLKPRST
ncbi:Cathepsin D precursor, putative [Perkinsus marinus ATCC 50983]|uniref:Cathepsin D, putative n=1 Tax=Perkinsus marinus (strain ATCC 50983 / TXsc) TaxID=423536 RepID=C5KPN1_PERM5|nr:Cathepsin D precursor, putative [Perkinsus marinus ATCC 50983]EER13562.1 Cathepsin D precursor, putative [Perkinsus marinus ATCC 50983]|eukprot:XP_002781767.1 Cathepsin D precursor, putative [Perkinsus marinus ATCC 50983]